MERVSWITSRLAVALAFVMSGVYASPGAAAGDVVRADLEGHPIAAAEVGHYHCEDLDFPVVHCYRQAADLERAVAARFALGRAEADGPQAAGPYVRVFADAGLTGASAYFSTAYDDLSSIGWNDRITSFQGLAGGGGSFFTNAYASGVAYPFSAYQQVTNVGSTFNDTFSSVRPR